MRMIVFFLLITELAYAQYPHDNKRDHIWMFGYDHSPPYFGGTCLDFNLSPVNISYVSQQINIDAANGSISDTNGNLLFYTNSMYVANANHQIMPNGDSLNPGEVFNWYGDYGYRLPQGAIILPMPGTNNLHYIIHEKLEFSDSFYLLPRGVYYTLINMNLDGNLGDVIDKNVLILDDTLDFGCITATRHANGRDWWVIIPEFKNNRYYRLLLTPNGIVQDTIPTIGTASYSTELGQVAFSPDGSKYVRFGGVSLNNTYRLEVFDFDRCTGLLSNYQNLNYIDTAWACGVAISPNSQFMYVAADQRVDQYNLNSSNIASTRQVVALYDGFTDPLFPAQTRFFLTQLAPDNKIYICTPGGTRFLHVIDQPDNEGIACNVLQHAIQLNTFNSSSIPNFPNFRLGPVDGSLCDSLGIDIVTTTNTNPEKEIFFQAWPNPAGDYFNYKIENGNAKGEYHLSLSDKLGRVVKEWVFSSMQNLGNFDISDLQQGSYILRLQNESGKRTAARKLIIVR